MDVVEITESPVFHSLEIPFFDTRIMIISLDITIKLSKYCQVTKFESRCGPGGSSRSFLNPELEIDGCGMSCSDISRSSVTTNEFHSVSFEQEVVS